MWHEARKQEKKIRGMIVDFRKRADRRKEFYERIVSVLYVVFLSRLHNCFSIYFFEKKRADPTQFLQLHGRKCKIQLEVSDLTDDTHM
jgi:arginine/serine-rich splicing factor 16